MQKEQKLLRERQLRLIVKGRSNYLCHTSVSRCTGCMAHLSIAKEIRVVGDDCEPVTGHFYVSDRKENMMKHVV